MFWKADVKRSFLLLVPQRSYGAVERQADLRDEPVRKPSRQEELTCK
jgi:hypothetical protein